MSGAIIGYKVNSSSSNDRNIVVLQNLIRRELEMANRVSFGRQLVSHILERRRIGTGSDIREVHRSTGCLSS